MASFESERFVKSMSVAAAFVARQLHHAAIEFPRQTDYFLHNQAAQPLIALGTGDSDAFDKATGEAAARQTRNDRELRAADHTAIPFQDI